MAYKREVEGRAIVLQQCGRCRRAGRMKRRLIRAGPIRIKEYLVKAKPQLAARRPPAASPDKKKRHELPVNG